MSTAAVFLTKAKDYVKLSCCSSVCYCDEFPRLSNVQGLDSVADFGKQNCNISLSQKPIIWFPELLLRFINGFDTVLGLSELIVNLR